LAFNDKITKSQFNHHTGMPQTVIHSHGNTKKMLLMITKFTKEFGKQRNRKHCTIHIRWHWHEC